ncbi:uncharacterized protein I303_106677 [Kwoniella dejecticola CBS 10117]|uniref:Mid2 domain-containing protein n=1 Tax=Kwoniella dejecticola CBS 10117 TaxID=1296121 RepID=A0A1A5ZU06_9TREE|nr:uncharacterized protein I303_08680 [Kwoniella dejecticola CBS 10117]OBR81294.1 hypothetical protein I303_08680 [Kwoniella dejecticola CBS 10117]
MSQIEDPTQLEDASSARLTTSNPATLASTVHTQLTGSVNIPTDEISTSSNTATRPTEASETNQSLEQTKASSITANPQSSALASSQSVDVTEGTVTFTQSTSSTLVVSTSSSSDISSLTTAQTTSSASSTVSTSDHTLPQTHTSSSAEVTSASFSSTSSQIASESSSSSQPTSSSIPPVPPAAPLFTSSSSSSDSTSYTPESLTSWDTYTAISYEDIASSEPAPVLANLQVGSSSAIASSNINTRPTQATSAAPSGPEDTPGVLTEIDTSNPEENATATMKYASDDPSPSASASIGNAADSAQSNPGPDTKDGGSNKLSAIAVVGIVGGILVGLIALYLLWYHWRKKRSRAALFDDDPEGDEKLSPTMYHTHNRVTRSSFGAADPITPWSYRYRNAKRQTYGEEEADDDDEDWYDPNVRQDGDQVGYTRDNANPFQDNLFDPSKTAIPPTGRTNYTVDYSTEEGEMRASLAEDNSPELLYRSNSTRSQVQLEDPMHPQNPFVPPIPPQSSGNDNGYGYGHGGLTRNETIRTVRTIPPGPDDVEDDESENPFEYASTVGTRTRPSSDYPSEPPTSKLLPWVNKGFNPENDVQPPLPIQAGQIRETEEGIRGPVKPAMNVIPSSEKPMGHGGDLAGVTIPSFR